MGDRQIISYKLPVTFLQHQLQDQLYDIDSRSKVQRVSSPLLTAEARVRFTASVFGIYGGQNVTETGFYFRGFPFSFVSFRQCSVFIFHSSTVEAIPYFNGVIWQFLKLMFTLYTL